jgi:hypothetical protein
MAYCIFAWNSTSILLYFLAPMFDLTPISSTLHQFGIKRFERRLWLKSTHLSHRRSCDVMTESKLILMETNWRFSYLCTFRIRCQQQGRQYLHRQTFWFSCSGWRFWKCWWAKRMRRECVDDFFMTFWFFWCVGGIGDLTAGGGGSILVRLGTNYDWSYVQISTDDHWWLWRNLLKYRRTETSRDKDCHDQTRAQPWRNCNAFL